MNFENRVPGDKGEELMGDCRKLHNEGLPDRKQS
jgi:hypothetical protein